MPRAAGTSGCASAVDDRLRAHVDNSAKEYQIVSFGPFTVVSQRHVGLLRAPDAWAALMASARDAGLLDGTSQAIEIIYDDLLCTPLQAGRFDTCLTITPEGARRGDISSDLRVEPIAAGMTRMAMHVGQRATLGETQHALSNFLARSAIAQPSPLCYLHYRSDPSDSAGHLSADVHIPVPDAPPRS